MTETKPIVTLIQDVVSSINIVGLPVINYQAGNSMQIIKSLLEKDNSSNFKDTKFPLIALATPVRMQRTEGGFYGRVKIPLITIAAISDLNTDVIDRYAIGGTFLTTLYPVYFEFLKQLSYNELVTNEDDGTFKHILEEDPGVQNIPETADFVDCINIRDLEFNFTQKINC